MLTSQEKLTVRMMNNDKYLTICFDYAGVNSIYGLSNVKYDEKVKIIDERAGKDEQHELTVSSDWIGPYMMKSQLKKDTNSPKFTGGWHGTNGDSTGNPTAFTEEIIILADKEKVKENKVVVCDELVIKVRNYINAYNTNYPVLVEEVTYTIRNNKINVYVQGVAKEELIITRYYGLQSQNSLWRGTVIYKSIIDEDDFYSTDVASQSIHKSVSTIKEYRLLSSDNSRGLVVGMDNEGLGDFMFLNENLPSSFTTDYGKSYFNLVNGKELKLKQDEKFYWKGYYIFL